MAWPARQFRTPAQPSPHEEDVWLWLEAEFPEQWTRELRFHPERKWRFDFASVTEKLAIEVEGLVHGYGKGRHQTVSGYHRDCEKYNEAVLLGWRILRITPAMIRSGTAWSYVRRATRTGL